MFLTIDSESNWILRKWMSWYSLGTKIWYWDNVLEEQRSTLIKPGLVEGSFPWRT